MDNKVVKFVGFGFAAYAVFAATVITFYEDDPDQMRWEDRQAFNKKFINELSIDSSVTKQFFIESLGSPDITEAKVAQDNSYQVMFYRTHHKKSDGITTKDECTPLLFKNGQLIAWGDGAYEQFSSI
jgi:hypothetical protein